MKARHFHIHELVPRAQVDELGERAWLLLDSRAVETLDALRDQFGSLIVNTATLQFRGWRPESHPSAKYSQHKFGRAFDCNTAGGASAEEMRLYILDHPDQFPHISAIELDVSWLHFDVRNLGAQSPDTGIMLFRA